MAKNILKCKKCGNILSQTKVKDIIPVNKEENKEVIHYIQCQGCKSNNLIDYIIKDGEFSLEVIEIMDIDKEESEKQEAKG